MELFGLLRLSETDAFSAFEMKTNSSPESGELDSGSSGPTGKLPSTPSTEQPVEEVDERPRAISRIPLRLSIYEPGQPGWRVACATASFSAVGDVKTLCIAADTQYLSEPIRLDARCQWIRKKGRKQAYYVAGFEITAISDEELEKVRSLIREILEEFQLPAAETSLQASGKPTTEAMVQAEPVYTPKFERTYELFLKGEGALSGPKENH